MKAPYRLKGLTLFLATLLAVGGLATATAPAHAAVDDPEGSVIGIVEDSAGNPLEGINVFISRTINDVEIVQADDTTEADGTFQFHGIYANEDPDVTYAVEASDDEQDFLTVRKAVEVKKDQTTEVTLTMRKAASISGKITRQDGKSPAGIEVFAEEAPNGTTTDANGNYMLKGLEGSGDSGSYLQFSDPAGDYLDQCFDNVLADPLSAEGYCTEDATKIDIPAGGDVTVKDQRFTHAAGHITGKVTDTKGRAIEAAEVVLYDKAGERLGGVPTMTTETGAYRIDRIPPGTWTLNVPSDPELRWADYWWKNATKRAQATPITIKAGGTVSGLAIKLKSKAALTVKATPGVRKATFALTVKKRSSGSPAGGKISVKIGTKTKTATLKAGKATITLKGLTKGKKSAKVSYLGSVNTAPASKTVSVTIK